MGNVVRKRVAGRNKTGAAAGSAPASKHYQEILREALEQERRRVARELHDGVNQLLASVQFRLQILDERWAGREEFSWREVLKCKVLIEKALQEVRRISRNLRPSELDELGLFPALRSLCQEFADRTGIAAELFFPDKPLKFSAEAELNLYRIAQEALSNIEKHSKASKVTVRAEQQEDCFAVSIRDDGRGFKPQAVARRRKSPGMGLLDMKERAGFLGGSCVWKSTAGRGTELLIQVPLAALKARK